MYTTLLAGSSAYALACPDIESFGMLPNVEIVPGAPDSLRGNVSYRGTFIPVVDLRRLFGQPSLLQQQKDLADSLVIREREHQEWLSDLKNSVTNGVEFKKTLDPTKCAFGQWYYNFKTHDEQLSRELKSFEAPHAAIHKLGGEVLALVQNGRKDEALKQIKKAEDTTLKSLVLQFTRVRSMLLHEAREVMVVIHSGEKRLGVIVDSILDMLQDSDLVPLPTQIDVQSPFYHSSFQVRSDSKNNAHTKGTAHLLAVDALFKHLHVLSCEEQKMQKLMAQIDLA